MVWRGVKECLVHLCQSHFCRHKIFIHKKQNHPGEKIKTYTWDIGALASTHVFKDALDKRRFKTMYRKKVLEDRKMGKVSVGCWIRQAGPTGCWKETQFLDCYALLLFYITRLWIYHHHNHWVPSFYCILYVKTLFTAKCHANCFPRFPQRAPRLLVCGPCNGAWLHFLRPNKKVPVGPLESSLVP